MPENNSRKPPTDFTIDCILSKRVKYGDLQRSPSINHPMNKVLDNPWISKFPQELTFNPSSQRKLSFPPVTPNFFDFYKPPIVPNFNDVAQHFTSVQNHFYPTATSSDTLSADNVKLLPNLNVYENKSCDKEIIRNSLSLSENIKGNNEAPTTPNSNFKCSVCSKTFENYVILDVSANKIYDS